MTMCQQAHSPPPDLSSLSGTLKALLRGMGERGTEIFVSARRHFQENVVTATEAVSLVITGLSLSVEERVSNVAFYFLLSSEEQCRAFLESEL